MNAPSRLAMLISAALLTCWLTSASVAADPAGQEKNRGTVQPLLTQDLPDIPGKEAVVLTVTYLPGGASLPHRHDADVFVYVLEGSVLMQVDGQPPVTLLPGQTFHEGPGDVHRQSANASATKAAKFVVFMIKDKGKPATRSVDP
ncbi:MAG TPA: cupin domain-containing protein [Steroidobacteraceae bacterium]